MNFIGFDFGTTNSLISVVSGDRTVNYLDEDRPIPSVVCYEGASTIVGRSAKQRLAQAGPRHSEKRHSLSPRCTWVVTVFSSRGSNAARWTSWPTWSATSSPRLGSARGPSGVFPAPLSPYPSTWTGAGDGHYGKRFGRPICASYSLCTNRWQRCTACSVLVICPRWLAATKGSSSWSSIGAAER